MKGFTGPVVISVSVRPEGETLRLRVRDNGRGLPDGRDLTPLEGIGISNVRRRLEALYPKRHAFSVHNLDGRLRGLGRIPWTPRRPESSPGRAQASRRKPPR